jgi:eukaryotic translation initiation factor 2C
MQNIQFCQGSSLQAWSFLQIEWSGGRGSWPPRDMFDHTMSAFQSKLREVGINAGAPGQGSRIIQLNRNQPIVVSQIEQFVKSVLESDRPQFLLIILPERQTELYSNIKLVCDVRLGIRNGCVVANKFFKPDNHQYFANVALKINLKLGGRNQSLEDNALGLIAQGKTMLVGLDVTHPSPGSKDTAPSIAAIVASVDRHLGQWPSEIRIQRSRQEMIEGLEDLMISRLKLWAKKNNNSYPDNIIVYRDGVSEGQYNIVLDAELPRIKSACQRLYPAGKPPRVSILIVGKRHHTRFYATSEGEADRSMNPQNGTVVDRGITEARYFDFFLQSHTALQGTARPAHYFTVWDEIFHFESPKLPSRNAADTLQTFTNNMTYLYGRATKAVSICPPAYYADLVCDRARRYLSQEFDAETTISGTTESSLATDFSSIKFNELVKDTMVYI